MTTISWCSSGGDESRFALEAAPDLVPEGPWKKVEGGVTSPKGFKAAGIHAGVRAGTKADLALVLADEPAAAAGVFTLNVMKAAPVLYCQDVLGKVEKIRAVLVNAGQANAATGQLGMEDAHTSAQAVAEACNARGLGAELTPDDVLLMSTGVIGRRINMPPLLEGVKGPLLDALDTSAEAARRAAVAITTTDLVVKQAALEVDVGGRTVRVGGMAKGSGMIHPNMATMLCMLTCDADVEASAWREIVKTASTNSFNQITVDGDTSTNDTVLALASGAAGGPQITSADSKEGRALLEGCTALLQGLSKSIAWDGEGATCLLEVKVTGAGSQADANQVARSICASSLAKAAVFGHDPNWGRIACAAGYSGVQFRQEDLRVQLGDTVLMEAG